MTCLRRSIVVWKEWLCFLKRFTFVPHPNRAECSVVPLVHLCSYNLSCQINSASCICVVDELSQNLCNKNLISSNTETTL
jgi:hypothetical protein